MPRIKNKGKAVLRESDTTFNNVLYLLSVLIVDRDQKSLKEVGANLRRCGYRKVTECSQAEAALTLLRMGGSIYDIVIIEQCLLGVNEFELLRIGREMKLPVIVTLEDGKPDMNQIISRCYNFGACGYLLKPIQMSDLKMVWKYMCLKKDKKRAQVQQLKNDVSGVREYRMSWTLDFHGKFVECVQELGGAKYATPKKILQLLQSKFKGFEDVNREQVSSHLQKYRDRLKKIAQLHMPGYKDKDGTNLEHIQSRYEMEEHPPMTLIDEVPKTTEPNQLDMLSQQQEAPAAKHSQGFQSVPLSFETNLPTIGGCTSGNQSNALMTQMDETLSSEQISNELTGGQLYESFHNDVDASTNDIRVLDGFPSLGTFQGAISGDHGFFFNNSPQPSPFLGEYGFSPLKGGQLYESFHTDIDASTNDIRVLDGFSSLGTYQGAISGDHGFFFNNSPPPSAFLGEYGFSQYGMFENFTGDVIAHTF